MCIVLICFLVYYYFINIVILYDQNNEKSSWDEIKSEYSQNTPFTHYYTPGFESTISGEREPGFWPNLRTYKVYVGLFMNKRNTRLATLVFKNLKIGWYSSYTM